jgi:hypothetical protein
MLRRKKKKKLNILLFIKHKTALIIKCLIYKIYLYKNLNIIFNSISTAPRFFLFLNRQVFISIVQAVMLSFVSFIPITGGSVYFVK